MPGIFSDANTRGSLLALRSTTLILTRCSRLESGIANVLFTTLLTAKQHLAPVFSKPQTFLKSLNQLDLSKVQIAILQVFAVGSGKSQVS